MNDNIQKKKKKAPCKGNGKLVALENVAESKGVLLTKQDAQKTPLSLLKAEFGNFMPPDSCHGDGDHSSDTSFEIDDIPSSEESSDQDWLKDLAHAELAMQTVIVPRKEIEAGKPAPPSLQPVCPAPSEPSPVSSLPSADQATLPADNQVPEEEEAFKCRPCCQSDNNDNQALKYPAGVSGILDISMDPKIAAVDEEREAARASLQNLLNREERNGIKLRMRSNKMASDLSEERSKRLKLQVDSEKMLSESQARVVELQSVIDEQNRKLQRQTAEKQTFSSQMKSVLEENSAKDALLASLNSRADKLICEIIEEKDKNLGFKSELEAALSDKTKAIGEVKRLDQELRQTEEECEKLAKQLDSRNQQRQEMSKLKMTVEDLEAILRLRLTEMHDLTVQNKTLWTEGKLVLARNQKLEEKYELLLLDHGYLQAVLNSSLKAQSTRFDMLLSDNQSKLADCQKAAEGLEKILETLQSNNDTLQVTLNSLKTDHHILLGKYNTLLEDKYSLQSVNQRDMPRVDKTI